MSSSRPPLSARPAFLPDEIARREFATVFRGYDPAEVRTFLNQLSEQAAELSDRIAEVQRALVETEERVKNPELDEDVVTRLLGEHTAQILRSAREAAKEMRAKADDEVSTSLRNAHEATTKMREEAETLLAERTEEAERMAEVVRSEAAEAAANMRAAAEQDAENIRNEANTAASSTREEAEREAADLRAQVADEVATSRSQVETELQELRTRTEQEVAEQLEKARASATDLIDKARSESAALVERTRDQQSEMIEGLVRKRKIALAQVEELRAGRQRLLKAYKMVRQTLDEVTAELERVEDEARQSAELAGVRSAQASDLVPEDLDTVVEVEAVDFTDDVSQEVLDLVAEEAGSRVQASAQGSDDEDPSPSGTFYDVEADNSELAGGSSSAQGNGQERGVEVRDDTYEAEILPMGDEYQTPRSRGGTMATMELSSPSMVLEDEELDVIDAEVEDEEDESTPSTAAGSRSSSIIIGGGSMFAPADDMDANLREAREATLRKARAQAVRRLKRALQDEQDTLFTRLRNGRGQRVTELIGSTEDQVAGYQRAILKLFREAVRTGASSVKGSGGIDRDIVERTGSEASRGLAAELVEDLRNQLVPVIEEMMQAEHLPEAGAISRSIAAPYRTVKGGYLEQLIDDRLGGAFDQGVAFARQRKF